MRMTLTRFRTLVTTTWLRDELCKPTALRVLDASATHDPQVDGYKEFYMESHIPQASYFHLHKLCPPSPTSLDKYPVPDINRFQDYAESLGVSNTTHVVAYDRSNTIFALKTWWLFRLFGHTNVSVLDGGLPKWLKDGFEVTDKEPVVQRSNFQPVFHPALLYNFEDMVDNLKTHEKLVIDSRPEDAFYNRVEGEKGGHLPGSKSLPYPTLFQEDGTFKSPAELKKVFDVAGVDLGQPLVFTCQRGMTACGLAAVAQILGKEEEVPVYNGSFREWGPRADPDQINEN